MVIKTDKLCNSLVPIAPNQEKNLSWYEQHEADRKKELRMFSKAYPFLAFWYEWRLAINFLLFFLFLFVGYQLLEPLLRSRIILPDPENHTFDLVTYIVSFLLATPLSIFLSQELSGKAYVKWKSSLKISFM